MSSAAEVTIAMLHRIIFVCLFISWRHFCWENRKNLFAKMLTQSCRAEPDVSSYRTIKMVNNEQIFTPKQQKTRFHLNSSVLGFLQKCQSWSFSFLQMSWLFHVWWTSGPVALLPGVKDGGDGRWYQPPSAHYAAWKWEQSSSSFCRRLGPLSFPVRQEIVPAHSW